MCKQSISGCFSEALNWPGNEARAESEDALVGATFTLDDVMYIHVHVHVLDMEGSRRVFFSLVHP